MLLTLFAPEPVAGATPTDSSFVGAAKKNKRTTESNPAPRRALRNALPTELPEQSEQTRPQSLSTHWMDWFSLLNQEISATGCRDFAPDEVLGPSAAVSRRHCSTMDKRDARMVPMTTHAEFAHSTGPSGARTPHTLRSLRTRPRSAPKEPAPPCCLRHLMTPPRERAHSLSLLRE